MNIRSPSGKHYVIVTGQTEDGFRITRINDAIDSNAKTTTRYVRVKLNTAFQGYAGKWMHLAVTYKGMICIIHFYHCYWES